MDTLKVKIQPCFLMPNPDQPRKVFDEETIKELAASILVNGLIQPIAAVRLQDVAEAHDKRECLPDEVKALINPNAYHMIIAGERRWRAACLIAREQPAYQLPVLVYDDLTEQQVFELSLVENVNRQDMLPMEEANAFGRMRDEYGLSTSETARKVGRSPDFIRGRLALLDLDLDIQALVNGNHIPLTVAVSISRLSGDRQHQVVKLMNEEGLNAMEACFLSDQLYTEQSQGTMFDLGAFFQERAAEAAAKWLEGTRTVTDKVKDALSTAIEQLSLPDLEAHAVEVQERITALLAPKPGEFAACALCAFGGSCHREEDVTLDGEACFKPAPGQLPECAECKNRTEDGCSTLDMLLGDFPDVERAEILRWMEAPTGCFKEIIPTLVELVEDEVIKEKEIDYLIGHLAGKAITDRVKVFVTKAPTPHEDLAEIKAQPEKDHHLLVVVKRDEDILLTLGVAEQQNGTVHIYTDLDFGVGGPRWDGVSFFMEKDHHYFEGDLEGGKLLHEEVKDG